MSCKRGALYLIVILLIVIPLVSADVIINDIKISPSSSVQGAGIDFCLDMTVIGGGGSPMATVDVTNPDNISASYDMIDTTSSPCMTLNGTDQFKYTYRDTGHIGNYTVDFTVKKGVDEDYGSGVFRIAPISIVVDYVDKVGTVDKCTDVDNVKSVNELNVDQMEMHGTEYFSDEPVKVWLQLLNGSNENIDDAVCYLWVYNPANFLYLTRANMYHVENGIYAYDFDAPYIGGVYPAISVCYYSALQIYNYATDFTAHVYGSVSGSYTDTYTVDTVDHEIKETTGGGNKRIAFEYEIQNMCNGSDSDLLTGFSVGVNAKWQSSTDDNLYIWWWNWTSSTWNVMPNYINYDTDRLFVSNSFETNNLSRDGYTDASGTMRIYFNDTDNTDTGATIAYIDYLYGTCDTLSDPQWSELKGSSEVHVTLDESTITGYLLSETDVNFASTSEYEGDVHINFTIYSRTLEPTDTIHYYELPKHFTCDDVNYFEWLEDNGTWSTYYHDLGSEDFTCEEDYTKDIVKLRWLRSLTFNEVDYYHLVLHNRFERIVRKYQSNINAYTYDMDVMCTNYYSIQGYGAKPSIPLAVVPNYNDSFADGCSHFWNTYYHFNSSINHADEAKTYVDDGVSLNLYEEHVHRIKYFYDILVTDFIIGGGLVGMYSAYTDMSSSGSGAYQFWSPYSTNSIVNQFLRLNMSNYVWNYNGSGERTLTSQEHIWVGGTEYSPDETTGKVVIRLVDNTDLPVNNANCTLSILYPNNTLFINSTPMTLFNNGEGVGGIYIKDFNLSSEAGVYPYGVDCNVVGGASPKRYFLLDTYHVFGANRTKQAEENWNYHNRTLSAFGFDVVDEDYIIGSVWNYTNRTLSTFDFDVTDEDYIIGSVWNYSVRDLTYYEVANVSVDNLTVNINNSDIAQAVWSWDGAISDNILNAFGDAIWEFIGAHAEVLT